MEFFGYTFCGPQNFIKDVLKKDYREPTSEDDVNAILTKLVRSLLFIIPSTCNLLNDIRGLKSKVKQITKGELNGFAYGSFERFLDMKKRGVIKLVNPVDMYRLPPTTSNEFGWWIYDPLLLEETWYKTDPRYPQPVSPNTLILDKVRKNNKYATLF